MALVPVNDKGKPYCGFHCDQSCEYGRKCKQDMQDQAHKKNEKRQ